MPCREATTEELATCHRRELLTAVQALSARVAAEQAAAVAGAAAGTPYNAYGNGGASGSVAANGDGAGAAAMPGMVRLHLLSRRRR